MRPARANSDKGALRAFKTGTGGACAPLSEILRLRSLRLRMTRRGREAAVCRATGCTLTRARLFAARDLSRNKAGEVSRKKIPGFFGCAAIASE